MDIFKGTLLSDNVEAEIYTEAVLGMFHGIGYDNFRAVSKNAFYGELWDYGFGWKYRDNKIEYWLWYYGSSKRPSLILSGKCSIFAAEWLKRQVYSAIERNENVNL